MCSCSNGCGDGDGGAGEWLRRWWCWREWLCGGVDHLPSFVFGLSLLLVLLYVLGGSGVDGAAELVP